MSDLAPPRKRQQYINVLKRLLPAPPAPATSDDARSEVSRGAWIMFVFFGLFLGWSAFAPLDAAVVAAGVVTVSGSRQTVQHRDGGVIARLAVEEGQRVERGDILIELSAPEVQARKDAAVSQVLDLQMQRARLLAEAQGAPIEAPPEWSNLPPEDSDAASAALTRHRVEAQGRRAALRSQQSVGRASYDVRIAGYQDEIASIDRQHSLLGDELAGVRSLADRGLMPLTRVRALERAQAELDGRRAELRAAIAGAMEDRAQELREIESRLAHLVPQLAGARAELENTLMRAPVSGIVVDLKANTVGGVIGPGEGVLDIVPEGQDLIVEAQVRPEDADDLRAGMPGEIRITAFSGRSTPTLRGEVRRVSADRLVDQRTGQPYFVAQFVVAQAELRTWEAASGGARLQPGLPAEMVTPTRKRTALQYLLEPLNQSLWRSFREG